jgi:hypothetical protein
MAVGSLVSSLLLFPLGLVLGLLTLARLDTRAERGKGLAVAAVSIAAAQIVALAVFVPATMWDRDESGRTGTAAQRAADSADTEDSGNAEETENTEETAEDPAPEAGEEISVFDIAVGDCFDSGSGLDAYGGDDGGEVLTVTRVSCEEPHEAEAFGTVEVEGYDTYPGDDELVALADRECDALVQGYLLDTWELPLEAQIFYYYPSRGTWTMGDREVLCFFGEVSGGDLSGELRGDAGEMTAEQLRYLEITTPLELAIWAEPPASGEPADRREWAGRMAEAVSREADALAAEEWPAETGDLIGELAEARVASLTHWRAASEETDEDALGDHIDAGYGTMGIDLEFSIRAQLGLTSGA